MGREERKLGVAQQVAGRFQEVAAGNGLFSAVGCYEKKSFLR